MPTNPVNTGLIDASPVVLNASATIYPDDRLGTLALIDSLPPGASVDNIFYFSINSEYYRRIIDAPMSAAYCGIYADGTDQTSNFAAAFSAGVRTIAFDAPAGAVFVINGTLTVPDGTVFQFHEGNMLGGTGTVTGGIIDASMYQQIFDISLTVTPEATTTGRFSVMWYGAQPGVVADAQPAIQASVDAALRGKKHATVYLPKGQYYIVKGIIVRRPPNDPVTPFASLDIVGDKHAFTDAESDGAESFLAIADPDDFCIGIQRGKGVTIQNLGFRGLNTQGDSITPLAVSDPETSWLSSGVRNTRVSPHAAVVIDPFGSSSTATGDRYPNWTTYYDEITGAGSTDVKVLDCFIRGFAVGIMNSPNAFTQNGDTMLFQNLWFYNCVSGIANGQSQTRTVLCYNTKFWGGVECCFDCRRYGNDAGSAMIVHGVNIAGAVKYLCASAQFGIGYNNSFSDVHAENLYSLGGTFTTDNPVIGGNISIKNSQIDLMGENLASIEPPVYYTRRGQIMVTCLTLEIENSFIGYYSSSDPSPMIAQCGMVILKNVSGSLIIQSNGEYENVVFKETCVNDGTRTRLSITNPNAIGDIIALYPGFEIFKNLYRDFANTGFQVKSKYLGRALNIYASNGTVTCTNIDPAGMTATLDVGSANIFKMAPGAAIFAAMTDDLGNNNAAVLGTILSVDEINNTITIVRPLKGLTLAFNKAISVFRPARIHTNTAFLIGDITASSNIIDNIEGEFSITNTLQAGDYFNHPAFIPGTYIKSVTSTSATLSTGALYSETGAFVMNEYLWETNGYCGELQTSGALGFYNSTVWKEGDIIRQGYSNNSPVLNPNIAMWVCVKAGKLATARPPLFKAVNFPTLSASDTSDFSVTVPAGLLIDGFVLNATAGMTITIGTTFGGTDIDAGTVLTSGVSAVVDYRKYTDAAFTVYFGGVTGGTLTATVILKAV